jgi:hypothetical protein
MRRWIEVNVVGPSIKQGLPGTIVTGREATWDARTHTRQEVNPHFITMPTKEILVDWLQSLTGQRGGGGIPYFASVQPNDNSDSPAADCTANHSFPNWGVLSVGFTFQAAIFNGFPPAGIPYLLDETLEPYSELTASQRAAGL